jgi:ATP-dependent Clp protease ATP-binding subunit ClpC
VVDWFNDARKAFVCARSAAIRHRHPYLDTEHLLIGLLATAPNRAAEALVRCGVALSELRARVEAGMSAGTAAVAADRELPFTPAAKLALERALEAASSRGSSVIGTEHLLVGLASSGGIAQTMLEAVGTDLDRLREEQAARIEGSIGDPPGDA